jgi:predicted permease
LPLEGSQMAVSFDIEERPLAQPDRPHSDIAIVTPGYFSTVGIPLLRGRNFTEHDDNKAPPVLVVNEAFAQKYFPGEDVIGKRIEPGAAEYGKTSLHEIVGVVANAKQVALSADPDPIYYFPYKQLSWFVGTIVLRTAVPPMDVTAAVRAALTELDREVPMYKVRTGDDLASMAIAGPRFLMSLMASFAGIALLLTVAGLYGVLSYAVARRRREIGLRIAVGAGRREVIGLVLRQALRLVVIGLGIGLAGAIVGGRLLESALYGTKPGDPAMIAGACGILLITSLAAAYVPAARAAAVDPMRALRSE